MVSKILKTIEFTTRKEYKIALNMTLASLIVAQQDFIENATCGHYTALQEAMYGYQSIQRNSREAITGISARVAFK